MASEVLSLWRQPDGAQGRESELSALTRELDEARVHARARFAFVRGPSGVGKSHLFRLFRQTVTARGADTFEADSPRDARRPFGVFAHLLPQLLDALAHDGAPSQVLAQLSRKVAPLTQGVPADGAERLAIFDAVSELFVLAGRSHPVFLFPDLDAADKSSLELFRYLAAVVSAPESRSGGLFVASFRDDQELAAPLRDVLDKVSARTVALSGLDLEGIRGFLARQDVAQKLFEVSGGMPDVLEDLLTRPREKPVELFLRRIERLTDGARGVLQILGVAPGALSQGTVAHALGALGLGGDVAADLDALVRQHIVTVRMVGAQPVYRFSRDVEKVAFAESLTPQALVSAKKALGEAFVAEGELAQASWLLLAADPARGAQVALQAVDGLIARGVNEEAHDLLLEALPQLGAEERPQVYRRLSELSSARADVRDAIRYLSRARVRGGADAAGLSVQMAGYVARVGRPLLAERLLARPLGSADGAIRSAARVQKVELALLRGLADDVLALRAGFDDSLKASPRLYLQLWNAVGRAHLLKGQYADADRVFEQNAAFAQAQGLSQDAARALVNRGVVAHKLGERQKAIGFYQAAAPHGERSVEARALANLGSIYGEDGEFELALEHLSRALQAFSRLSSAREVAHAASNLARLYAFLGDLSRAIELSEHALKRAREIGERYLEASALLNLGEAHLDKRELHDAARHFSDARALFEQIGSDGFAALAAAQKARTHLLLGERAQATSELSRKVVEKGSAELPAAMIEVELVKGELSLSLGDFQSAGRCCARAREALLHKPELEGPYRVYFLMGQLRAAAGDASGAQAELARAGRLLDELTQRVPPVRRQAFLSIPRRAEVLAQVEPELRLPRLGSVAARVAEVHGHGLAGRSGALLKITRQIEPIARANATVLIRGESGTGKELLAQAIHDLSPRKAMPLVKVNCAAMVEELLLSELFGHEKGAFTGAVRERKGRFELADGGTIFLDEIGDISPKAQVALLRVLQEREFERVGGTRTLKVDVRVICATNRDLEAAIAQGRFRQDLYYRLKGVMLELPPLRDRLEDLPVLAQHFLTRVGKERGEAPRQLSQDALELLGRHSWPGNVRELENVLSSAAIFAEGALITPDCFAHVAELSALMGGAAGASALPPQRPVELSAPIAVAPPPAPSAPVVREMPAFAGDDDDEERGTNAPVDDVDFYALARTRGLSLKELRRQLEMQCIRRALLDSNGNISEAARLLKMKRSRLSQIVNSEPELKGVCHGDE